MYIYIRVGVHRYLAILARFKYIYIYTPLYMYFRKDSAINTCVFFLPFLKMGLPV